MIIKTVETCPVCGNPEMTVKHGVKDGRTGARIHIEKCPGCGDHYPVVGYDCPDCNRANEQAAKGDEHPG